MYAQAADSAAPGPAKGAPAPAEPALAPAEVLNGLPDLGLSDQALDSGQAGQAGPSAGVAPISVPTSAADSNILTKPSRMQNNTEQPVPQVRTKLTSLIKLCTAHTYALQDVPAKGCSKEMSCISTAHVCDDFWIPGALCMMYTRSTVNLSDIISVSAATAECCPYVMFTVAAEPVVQRDQEAFIPFDLIQRSV